MIADAAHLRIKIASGNEVAFSELYKIYNQQLKQFSKSLVRSSEIAEETVEDVFIKIWRNRAGILAIENLTVYLYIAVKNASLNRLSKKAKELITSPFHFLDMEMNQQAINPFDVMITSEMLSRMQKEINQLPPRCKIIFKLIREDGLKYKEVAQILNISVNTIDAQMAIAVKRICNALHIQIPRKNSSKILFSKKG